MKKLFIYILLFCIFCNFFSYYILNSLNWFVRDRYNTFGFVPEKYFNQCDIEMFIIFVIICIISWKFKFSYKKFNLKQFQGKYTQNSIFVIVSWAIYTFFVVFVFLKINWTFENLSRGVGQFELENRQTFLSGITSSFYVPFLIYLYLVGFFRRNFFFLIIAVLIYAINGISHGGRGSMVVLMAVGLMVINYIHELERKKLLLFVGLAFLGLTFTSTDRFSGNDSLVVNNLVKIIQCNSTSTFLPVVKYSIDQGIELSPGIFAMHFVSIFIPSYVYVNVFHMLSYTRSSFIYSELYNANPNSGMGFMMLADFYWSFQYLGYVLWILTFYLTIRFFRKYIYSSKPVLVVMSIMIVYYFCDQRTDFGAFLKPLVYTWIFLNVLEYFRKSSMKKQKLHRSL